MATAGKTLTIADGGHAGTGLVTPHRRQRGQAKPSDWKGEQQVPQAGMGPRTYGPASSTSSPA